MPPLMRLSALCSSSSSSVPFPRCAFLLHFSQFSTSSSSSISNHSFHSSSSSRRHDEESRNVRVSVWWDFENCSIPSGVNVFKISHLITAAVRANGIKGPLQITAFGDILRLSRTHQVALTSTGITISHIPQGGKNSADRSLLVDLMFWVSQNPPPAHLFLISGDRDFASILHRLRMNNYNVLLASPESAPGVLCSAASIMWQWNALIKGENLVGRHFNQPPDGSYSWYGHSKVPLEDPFSVNDQPSSSQDVDIAELSSDPKPRPIPEKVTKQICYILKLHPKGISGTELRSELRKSNISMDDDFYGHKNFSRFLLSMPHILKLQATGDGHFTVRLALASPKPTELLGSIRGSSDNVTGEQSRNLIAKLNNDTSPTKLNNNASLTKLNNDASPTKLNIDGSPTESMSEPILPSSELNAQDRPLEIQPSSRLVKSTGEAMVVESSTCPVPEQHVIEDSKRTSKLEADSNMIPSIGEHSELLGSIRGSSDNVTGEQSRNLIAKLNNDASPTKLNNDASLTKLNNDASPTKLNIDGSPTESMSEPILPSSELNAQDRPLGIQPSSRLVKSTGEAMVVESSTCPVPEQHVIEDSKRTSKLEADSNMIPSIGEHSEAKTGFFRRIWRNFFGSKDHNSENESHHGFGKCSTSDNVSKHKSCSGNVATDSSDNLREGKSEGKTVKPISQDANSMHSASNSPHCESAKLQKAAVVSNAYDDKSSSNPGLLGSIRNWFKFGRHDAENGKVGEHCPEPNQVQKQSGNHQIFSNNSFWQDMQSFMETPKALELISQSKTRSEMAQNLLAGGPLALKSLSTSELFEFLELLISDKKWVEECPSETNPFKLTLSTSRKSPCTKQPLHGANGLSSIFMTKASHPGLQRSPEQDSVSGKKDDNIPQAGISSTVTKKKFPERTRNETIRDCQKLLDEILNEHPDGYNIGSFRKVFTDKYGYNLNLPKLGYPKLASLLQIMPGVTVVSNLIVPTSKARKVSNLETTLPNDMEKRPSHVEANSNNEQRKENDTFESIWEELGPACTVCSSGRNEDESTLSRETAEVTEKRPKVEYQPILLEHESTDSDEEEPIRTPWKSEEQAKPRINEEESSLLQILDSWYSSKEENSRKDKSENGSETVDCSDNSLKSCSVATNSEADKGSLGRKQRHQKSYSFVSDTDGDNKVKMLDRILGTLNKSSESQIQN